MTSFLGRTFLAAVTFLLVALLSAVAIPYLLPSGPVLGFLLSTLVASAAVVKLLDDVVPRE